MATIIRSVQNITPVTITLQLGNVVLLPSAIVDLYTVVSDDVLLALQEELQGLSDRNSISIILLDDKSELLAGGSERDVVGDLTINGVIIARKDNATSLRVSGPSHASENAGAVVQSYSGVFYNDSFDVNGLLKTRFITGGNEGMDLELQSSNAILISAVGENAAGFAKIAARTNVIFNVRDEADQDSPKQLIIDRVDMSTVGAANTSDVNIKSTGNIHINAGVTTGAFIVPKLTSVEIAALVAVAGMVVYDTTTNKHQGYDGSAWQDLY